MRFSSARLIPLSLLSVSFAVACGGSDTQSATNGGAGNVSTIAGAEAPDESNGIFVSADAKSVGQGTRSAPFNSLAACISAGKEAKKPVYACATTYTEQVELVAGVSMYGNYDCTTWTAIDQRATIATSASPAVKANAITSPTTFYGFEVAAPAGTREQPTAIALLAVDSDALSIANSILKAGRGANGVDGVEGTALTLKEGDGKPARPEGECQGSGGVSACLYQTGVVQPGGSGECIGADGFASEKGGAGGNSGFFKASCMLVNLKEQCIWAEVNPGMMCEVTPGESFGRGGALPSPGANGSPGTSCTTPQLSEEGYQPCDGTAGSNGSPGHGGAGGDGVYPSVDPQAQYTKYFGTGGASGGSGGCPGLAGTAGTGGGASIAALLIASAATFDHVDLISNDGGNGGKGTFGSPATKGGKGGAGKGKAEAQDGSAGGEAGISGSGAGGPSFGVASHGTAPKMIESKVTAGQGGHGVDELQANGKIIPASSSGKSEASYSF